MSGHLRSDLWSVTDGILTIRPPRPGDTRILLAGRDEEWERWMGPGGNEPNPSACIVKGDDIIGWVDYERGHEWLSDDEVNLGYNVFAPHRRRGHATRAVRLLMHRLAVEGIHRSVSVMIDHGNVGSLHVARGAGFGESKTMGDSEYLRRLVPPLRYEDGVVAIRRPRGDDLEADLAAKDEPQQRWLWTQSERDQWAAMDTMKRREHTRTWLATVHEEFGRGPRWNFVIEGPSAAYVGVLECNLASPECPRGEANLSYASHPAHRGRGYVTRGLRLALRFLGEHTSARIAHIEVDPDNEASLRVARSLSTEAPRTVRRANGQLRVCHRIEFG